MKRTSGHTHHGANRRDPNTQRRPGGPAREAPPRARHDEPEPIRIPAGWELSPKRSRAKALRVAGKVGIALVGFGLLTLPFVINHMDRGVFYYQEVPVDFPDAPLVETPLSGDLPVAPVDGVGVPAVPEDVPEHAAESAGDAEAEPVGGEVSADGVDAVESPVDPIGTDAVPGSSSAE